MSRIHDFDAGWKTILEAFEKEIVEILFPALYEKIDWSIKPQALDNELREIQKEIYDKDRAQKIISDKIIKVHLRDNTSKLVFIHVEVQSSKNDEDFGERMFRYFYRIWDKFRYKYSDKSEIIGAAIYTYKGRTGKENEFIYTVPDVPDEIIRYNFKAIDVEELDLSNICNNPLKLVFKMAKELLKVGASPQKVYESKVELANELDRFNNVTPEQAKALGDFLEYLFLIDNEVILYPIRWTIQEKGIASFLIPLGKII